LFLELVRIVSESEPELAAKALDGLAKYEDAPRLDPGEAKPAVASVASATVRDHGGSGPPVLRVPSLINPPSILDLDREVSLTDAIANMGRRVLLVDWGEASGRADFSVGDCVEAMLAPMLRELGEPVALVGYCLGGTMAIAAANLAPVERVATLAAPWNFAGYPQTARDSLSKLWAGSESAARRLGQLPMEVLQAAFWSLDPRRTVAKFAAFAELDPRSDRARRFVTLEDWANEGEPLPFPAARELMEGLFGGDCPGRGEWRAGGLTVSDALGCPVLNITASNDRITPASTAPAGNSVQVESGHVGMVVGSARSKLHEALAKFLSPSCR
jgi:polyhydroxyalkanoate synthase